jgi:catechol 2,3-dioxygenase-like lactoylglutathione lyase family enzyme
LFVQRSVPVCQLFAAILGRPEPTRFGPSCGAADNGVSLTSRTTASAPRRPALCLLVSEREFDAIFGRIKAQELDYWADPARGRPGEINRHDGGRGVYFPDPDGHLLEIITRPYGTGG